MLYITFRRQRYQKFDDEGIEKNEYSSISELSGHRAGWRKILLKAPEPGQSHHSLHPEARLKAATGPNRSNDAEFNNCRCRS